jgi:hypothetical protein
VGVSAWIAGSSVTRGRGSDGQRNLGVVVEKIHDDVGAGVARANDYDPLSGEQRTGPVLRAVQDGSGEDVAAGPGRPGRSCVDAGRHYDMGCLESARRGSQCPSTLSGFDVVDRHAQSEVDVVVVDELVKICDEVVARWPAADPAWDRLSREARA